MRGTIRKRTLDDGTRRYDVRYRAAGRQRTKTFRRRKDADRFLAKQMTAVHDGSYVEMQPTRMGDVFDSWLDDVDTRVMERNLKASTAATYRSGINKHLLPAFGDFRSDQLTPAVMSKWRRSLATRIAAGTMARKTFNNIFNQLHVILEWARLPAQSFLAHDPLIGQKRFKRERREAEFCEDDDITALLKAAADAPEGNAIIHLGLFAGLRRGEIFALQWRDIEGGNGEVGGRIRVRRSLYAGEVTTPKTAAGERTVDAPQRVLDVLAAHRATCPSIGQGFIFRTRTGAPIDPSWWYRETFVEIRKRAKLRPTVSLHSLRHTYASLLIRQGENPKYVSRQLGHASTSFTMDVYGHCFETTSTEAMQRLNCIIPEPMLPELRVVEARGA